MLSLDIIIVNWNAGQQLRDCLESIVSARRDGFSLGQVVVVDNASSDGSLEGLDSLPLPLDIIRNPINRGFGAACNQGAALCDGDYLLFLNPDIRLFPDSLTRTIQVMERAENQDIGICGIQMVDETGQVARSCARFPDTVMFFVKMTGFDRLFPLVFRSHFMFEWDHLDSRKVDQVMGAFFLVRRKMFGELGGFDEQFFVYFEEVDFSFRARQAGWGSYYLADAQAYHKGGGTSEQVKATRLFYSLRSRILYGYKHFGVISATALLCGTLLLEPLARLAQAVGYRSTTRAVETVKAFGLLLRTLPASLAIAFNRRGHDDKRGHENSPA